MSPLDCDLDLDAPSGQRDDRALLIDPWKLFGCDESEEPMESKESDDFYWAALKWMKRGYNVVPQKAVGQKHPGVKWKDLQARRVTKDELLQWRSMFANGVGFVTGAISGVIVIETDGLAGETLLDEFECQHGPLPTTLIIRSGSQRGFHRHYRYPGHKVKTVANENIKIDVRGDGGFCVLPPSKHKSGGDYEIVHDAEPAALPQGLLDFIEAAAEGKKPTKTVGRAQGAPKGEETRPPYENRFPPWPPSFKTRSTTKRGPPPSHAESGRAHLSPGERRSGESEKRLRSEQRGEVTGKALAKCVW